LPMRFPFRVIWSPPTRALLTNEMLDLFATEGLPLLSHAIIALTLQLGHACLKSLDSDCSVHRGILPRRTEERGPCFSTTPSINRRNAQLSLVLV
jgi:hypothetical protein